MIELWDLAEGVIGAVVALVGQYMLGWILDKRDAKAMRADLADELDDAVDTLGTIHRWATGRLASDAAVSLDTATWDDISGEYVSAERDKDIRSTVLAAYKELNGVQWAVHELTKEDDGRLIADPNDSAYKSEGYARARGQFADRVETARKQIKEARDQLISAS